MTASVTINITRDPAREGARRIAAVMRKMRRLAEGQSWGKCLNDPIADLALGLTQLRDAGVPVPPLNVATDGPADPLRTRADTGDCA